MISLNRKFTVISKKIEPIVLPEWCYFSKAASVQLHHKIYVSVESRHGRGELFQISENGRWERLSAYNPQPFDHCLSGCSSLLILTGRNFKGGEMRSEKYSCKRNKWKALPSLSSSEVQKSCVLKESHLLCFPLTNYSTNRVYSLEMECEVSGGPFISN